MRFFARTGVAVAGAVVMAVVAAGPAAAHFCYKTDRNETSNAAISKSKTWMSFADIAQRELPDLCPAGVAFVAAAAGATPTTMINTSGTMAGGTLKKGADSGTPSISHLDVDGLFGAVEEAYGLCATG